MWASLSEKASKGLTDALNQAKQSSTEATKHLSEALEKTGFPQSSDEKKDNTGTETPTSARGVPQLNIPNIDQEKVLKNLQMGWSSVVETTKKGLEATKDVVDTERARLEENFSLRKKGFYRRDPNLPIDADALRDAEVTYITDRIISMSHPAMASKTVPMITAERKLAAVGHLLSKRHADRFLVYNLSEVDYDTTTCLSDQVWAFSFPGSPSPPLGLLLKLLISMESWMKADERNVVVVHCLTGKGRTSMVLAAFLCWVGEAGFGNINDALSYIARCKQVAPEDLTIPSQRRYASYFKNILDGVRPSQPPLLLKRIILSEAPKFAKGPKREDLEDDRSKHSQEQLMGCAPYLQIFKAGKLIFTTAATVEPNQSEEDLPFVQASVGTVPFNIDQVIHGDILIRSRHLTEKKQRVSMFRAAFHTGYVPPNVLRLTKSQLDGACSDQRYTDDFFLDLIFEKVDAETATKHLEEEAETEEHDDSGSADDDTRPTIKASSYDTMLNGDSRFWDVIEARKKEHAKQKNDNPMWGPTVGRRRRESKRKESSNEAANGKVEKSKAQAQLEAFSIGNDFDFLPAEPTPPTPEPKNIQPKKDSLMEALNALDHDEGASNDIAVETEEIVFGETPDSTAPASLLSHVGATTKTAAEGSSPENTGETPPPQPKEENQSQSGDIAEESDDFEDMDALLASVDDDFGDVDLAGFEVDDDLDDLESLLAS